MKPQKIIVPLAVGLSWTAGGLFQQKLDGRFATLATAGGELAGENVGGVFTAFDCVGWQGQDVRGAALVERLEAWTCRVAAFNGGRQSVAIVDSASGQARGNLPLFGGRCDRVRVGSILKVEGFGLHASGLIREGRVCKDTAESWLIQF
jgi:hypothetical protein